MRWRPNQDMLKANIQLDEMRLPWFIPSPPFYPHLSLAPSSSPSNLHRVIHPPSTLFLPHTPRMPLCLIIQSLLILPADGSVQQGPRAPLHVPLISIHRQQKTRAHVHYMQYTDTHTQQCTYMCKWTHMCTHCTLYTLSMCPSMHTSAQSNAQPCGYSLSQKVSKSWNIQE